MQAQRLRIALIGPASAAWRLPSRCSSAAWRWPDNGAVQRGDVPSAFAAVLMRFAKANRAVVTRDQRLQADLGIDSLSMIDVACATEDAFGIWIPDEDLERFSAVGDAVHYIRQAKPAA